MSPPTPLRPLLREVRKRADNPFGHLRRRPLLVHCGQHRSGTVWFARVLDAVARHHGLRVQRLEAAFGVRSTVDLVIYEQGGRDYFAPDLPTDRFRATHIVRDPRDMVVSGYHFHLWTSEPWAISPWERYGGRTYQQVLRSMPEEEGLAEEIRMCSDHSFPGMLDPKWDDPRVLGFRYEDLLADEAIVFTSIFEHYGFDERSVRAAVERAHDFTFAAVTGRAVGEITTGDHLRSGRPGEWREVLTADHLALLDQLNPGLVDGLGYADHPWRLTSRGDPSAP